MSYNTLWDQCEAADRFGWDRYWMAEKDEQKAMVGFTRAKGLVRAMSEWDQLPESTKRKRMSGK